MANYLNFPGVPPSQFAQPQNALLSGSQNTAQAGSAPAVLAPAVHPQLLRSTIGHAAVLSDTPEKWAATIGLLKQHGIDPGGYEDFEKGRQLAIAAAGVGPLPDGGPD